jgi:hypothetical protein
MSDITVVDLNAEPSEPVEKQEDEIPTEIEKPSETLVEQIEPPKAKKQRAPRKKKEVEPEPEPEPEPEITKIEPIKKVKASRKKKVEEVNHEPIIEVEQPKEVEQSKVENKNIKTIELVKCDKCNKQLTKRTLKYSHQSVCPAMKPATKPAKVEKVEQVNQEPTIIRKPIRISARTERYKNLVVNAF